LCWWHSTFWPVKYSCCLLLQLGLPKYSRTQRHVRRMIEPPIVRTLKQIARGWSNCTI
jgi:hypothetical protein